VYIKFNEKPKSATWITVSDILGKVVLKIQSQNIDATLNLKGNPPGLYFIKVGNINVHTYIIILQ